ncbi:MAG: helix-turn-helix domain containing protein [Anaerolineaceae bacterium]|nr:helix-turn-helix domain containing protein [Anaerolineaceae bacterium]
MNTSESISEQEVNIRQARAERILDVAAELYQRHGYKRVTIDDIAERAEIGKGTIYLHWKTRQELSVAVIEREMVSGIDEFISAIQQDPNTVLPHRIALLIYLIIMRRPMLRALYTGDWNVLGKLAKGGLGGEVVKNISRATSGYLSIMVECGVIRPGISITDLTFLCRTTVGGFFLTDAILSETYPFTLEHKAELLADVVRRAFEAETSPAPEAIQLLASRTIELLTKVRAEIFDRLGQAYQ